MNKTFWDEIWHLIVQRGWVEMKRNDYDADYSFEFYSKDQGIASIRVYIYVKASNGYVFLNASDPSLNIGRQIEFLETFRQLFNTFDGIAYNQKDGVFNFYPKTQVKMNIDDLEKAIDLCIKAVRSYHRAIDKAKKAILDSHGKINP